MSDRTNTTSLDQLAVLAIIGIIRDDSFRRIAIDQLNASVWYEEELSLLWSAVENLVRNGVPVNKNSLSASVIEISDGFSPQAKELALNLVDETYNWSDEEVSSLRPYMTHILWRLIAERSVLPELRSISISAKPDNIDLQIEALYRKVQRARSLSAAEVAGLDLSKPGYLSGRMVSTGVPFLDEFMVGYADLGELHGLLGPTGAGKTTLGVQILVSAIMYSRPRGPWFYVTYETSPDELQCRMLSCAARVPRDLLATWRGIEDPESYAMLSRSGNLKEYELKMYRGKKDAPGELERLQNAYSRLMPLVKILPGTKRGSQLFKPQVVRATIEKVCTEMDLPPGGIVVDYVGVAALKLQDADRKDRPLRTYINIYEEAMHEIADEYRCPVWLLHQITGSALSKKPSNPLTHDMAQESKSFANPLTFCFCLGNMDRETMCVLLNCSKSRRSRPKPPVVLKMHESFAMYEHTEEYVANPYTGSIMKDSDI